MHFPAPLFLHTLYPVPHQTCALRCAGLIFWDPMYPRDDIEFHDYGAVEELRGRCMARLSADVVAARRTAFNWHQALVEESLTK